MHKFGIALIAIGMLTACSAEQAPAPDNAADADAAVSTTPGQSSDGSETRALGDAEAYDYKQESGLYKFGYSFPATAPALAAILKREAESAETRLKADAAQFRDEAKVQGFPYHAYEILHQWKQVASIPRFQSLSAQIYAYTGGAHGNTGFDALVWDREASAELKPIDMFTSVAALNAVIQQPFCRLLDQERVNRRGQPIGDPSDSFNDCIDPLEQTLILGSSNGKTFDRLGILIGPYAAGSYAEGDYDITLPVTSAVLETVKPAYRSAFSAAR